MSLTALDPQARSYLEALANAPSFQATDNLDDARHHDPIARMRGSRTEIAEVRDLVAAGVPVRLYDGPGTTTPSPAIVYLHGGGWVFGDLDKTDNLCRDMAARCAAVVISVDYRLAPAYRYPAAVHDAGAVVRHIIDNAGALGVDPARVAIWGDSSGGNLAAAAAGQAADVGYSLVHQLLVYPVTDTNREDASYQEFADGFGLTAERMTWFLDQYAGDADRDDPGLAPIRRRDKSVLPPTTIIVAECDVLRDQGLAYAQQLRQAGVDVEVLVCRGMVHGFFGLPGAFDQAVEARRFAAKRLVHEFTKNGEQQ